MSMQLFSFGHPCEHQLRRTCIGGSSCPLNGYPDIWCCSYIKGKINFKRDKPCEGPRCRWGFTHPTQQQFDAVTQVLNESRPIAAKIDEADDKELLSFHIDNPHLVDTVQCALHMMRHPPSSCARRVGQLLACAAVKAGDAKVFMQLLKTMKKPVDSYILGAYFYLTQGNPSITTRGASAGSAAAGAQGKEAGKGRKGADKGGGAGGKKDDVAEELMHGMVDLMNAALSQGGQLVDREDQRVLQATFIQALRQYPRANRRRQEQLDAALALFGNRPMAKEQPKTAAAEVKQPAVGADDNAIPIAAAEGSAGPVAAPAAATGTAGKEKLPPPPSPDPAALTGTHATTTATTTPKSAAAPTPKLAPTAQAPPPLPATPKQTAPPAPSAKLPLPSNITGPAAPTAAPVAPPAAAAAVQVSLAAAGMSPLQQPSPTSATAACIPAAALPHSAPLTISDLVKLRPPSQTAAERRYDPIRTDSPLPDILIMGGLFSLSPNSVNHAPLGPAPTASAQRPPALRAAFSAVPAHVLPAAFCPVAFAGPPCLSASLLRREALLDMLLPEDRSSGASQKPSLREPIGGSAPHIPIPFSLQREHLLRHLLGQNDAPPSSYWEEGFLEDGRMERSMGDLFASDAAISIDASDSSFGNMEGYFDDTSSECPSEEIDHGMMFGGYDSD